MAFNSNWCDLPAELLDVVVNLLLVHEADGGDDRYSVSKNMRSVCSSWRSAVPPPCPVGQFPAAAGGTPIKLLDSSNPDAGDCRLRLAKHTILHLSTSKQSSGWVIKVEQQDPCNSFHSFHPFSRTRIISSNQTPSLTLDLTNVNVRELGHEYVLHNVVNDYNELHRLCNMEGEKVTLISNFNTISNNDYVILSTHNTGKLLIYQSTLREWSFLDDFNTFGFGFDNRSIFVNDWCLHYVDVVEYEGTFYAVTNCGTTLSIKLVSNEVMITLLAKFIIGGDTKCLVKSAGDLLLIDLYTSPKASSSSSSSSFEVLAVEIYKLDKKNESWSLVKTLGDRVIFLSNFSCFSASSSVLPGCKPNSVYFHFKDFDTKLYDQFVCKKNEIGVFDVEKGVVGSLEEHLQDLELFSWPPPDWLFNGST